MRLPWIQRLSSACVKGLRDTAVRSHLKFHPLFCFCSFELTDLFSADFLRWRK